MVFHYYCAYSVKRLFPSEGCTNKPQEKPTLYWGDQSSFKPSSSSNKHHHHHHPISIVMIIIIIIILSSSFKPSSSSSNQHRHGHQHYLLNISIDVDKLMKEHTNTILRWSILHQAFIIILSPAKHSILPIQLNILYHIYALFSHHLQHHINSKIIKTIHTILRHLCSSWILCSFLCAGNEADILSNLEVVFSHPLLFG